MKPSSQLPDINLKELAELCASTPDGLVVEIGVYKGGSAWAINEASRGRKLHLFDTFKGIPEKSEIDNIHIGSFGDVTLGEVTQFFPHAIFHVGKFPDTLTDEVNDIAFAHIDCDQYATCKAAIERLWPRMVPGGIMAWDDYGFGGIQKAIHETFQAVNFTECKIPYVIKENK